MKPKGWTAAVAFALTIGLVLTSAAGEKDDRKEHRKERQTVTVFVPSTASGGFGNDGPIFPMVEALTVTRRGKITITYVSGLIITRGDIEIGPEGIDTASGACLVAECNGQFPLQEAVGISGEPYANVGAVIGVFVPASQTSLSGFLPIDTVRNVADRAPRAGIVASTLFLVGSSATIRVNGPGTLFLGINDNFAGDDTGGFTVQVTGPQ